jgi:hypothetical protein
MSSHPKLSQEARREHVQYRKEYGDALENVARQLAIHDKSERVLLSHLMRARGALIAGSDQLQPWWSRRETLTAAGSFAASAAFGTSGTASAWLMENGSIPPGAMPAFWTWAVAVPALLFTGGVTVAVYGWLR